MSVHSQLILVFIIQIFSLAVTVLCVCVFLCWSVDRRDGWLFKELNDYATTKDTIQARKKKSTLICYGFFPFHVNAAIVWFNSILSIMFNVHAFTFITELSYLIWVFYLIFILVMAFFSSFLTCVSFEKNNFWPILFFLFFFSFFAFFFFFH